MFSCTALNGTNKQGILTPDADGYYTLVLGGLNVYNSAGAYYPLKRAEALFEESSIFMRRVRSGCLKAECGHPKKLPGMSMREFISRVMTVEETNVAAHISDVWLDFDGVKDKNGRAVVAIMGKVKPAGPRGPALKEALDNPKENVCFSIRSLTDDRVEAGQLVKYLKSVLAFDWVVEPGIDFARKYNAPSLESYEEHMVIPAYLETSQHPITPELNMSFESNGISMESLKEELGWNAKGQKVPASLGW